MGEEVWAIGSPVGLDQTLTRGVVSAINRILPETAFSFMRPFIQVDAAINPGNSGGPLVNRCGEIVGIITAILSDAQNIGFAVPVDLVKSILPELLATGHIARPWLGIQGQLVPSALKELLRAPLTDGLLVEVVESGSPGAEAGIRGGHLDVVIGGRELLLGGDIITRVNGQPVETPDELVQAMGSLRVGDTVRLTLFRGGKTQEVEFLLPERPILPQDLLARGAVLPWKSSPAFPAHPSRIGRSGD